MSLWVRDLPRTGRLSYEHWRISNASGAARYLAAERPIREARRQCVRARALAQIGALSERELLIAGAIAYWCEGSKNKPYRRHANRVIFINSDPGLILFFLRFLALAGISTDRLIFMRLPTSKRRTSTGRTPRACRPRSSAARR